MLDANGPLRGSVGKREGVLPSRVRPLPGSVLLVAHRDSGRPPFASSDDEPVVPPPAAGSSYATTPTARRAAAASVVGGVELGERAPDRRLAELR